MLGKHLSLPWRTAFLSLDQLPRFCSPHLQCCEISLRVPLTWNMLPVSPPLRHLTFFFFWSQALASFMPISSAWLSSPGYTEFQVVATSAFPEWEISSITAFYIQSKFFFQHYHFSFSLSLSFLNSIFVGQMPSFDYPFLENVTWVYHLEIRRHHHYMFCCLCVNSQTHRDQPVTDTERYDLVTDHDACMLFT